MKLFVGIDVSDLYDSFLSRQTANNTLNLGVSLLPMTSKVLHSYEKQFLNSMTATTLIKL
ncbi:hypothetical protein EfmJHP38_21610 [Enterococcus faecium]|nr:hypothetical protein EfmJHP38_21610 [Enterococcus faecium]